MRARRTLQKTERSTKRLTKTALLGIYNAKPAAGSAGPEARYGSVRTSWDHRPREGEEARTTTKSPPHRLAQPIFHHKRKTWTTIASCDNWPLLRRLLILD